MNYRLLFLCLVYIYTNSFENVACDGVLGCGGFVKSDVEINYSLVEVKLYTSHGSIKYQTDCAPNTGYYLIPLYDKGEFVLQVEPPKGWSFEPDKYDLQVDGESDKCSLGEDINFKFTGFSVDGRVVSKGQPEGPVGVNIALIKAGSNEIIEKTVTAHGGGYKFGRVLPGDYEVKASHSKWKFETASVKITVSTDNGYAGNGIVIAGYDVTGKVQSEGESIKGVSFILYSKQVTQQMLDGCDKKPVKGYKNTEQLIPLCSVISKEDGVFVFPHLPPADYFLVPFYKGEQITFDVVPTKLEFKVEHDSLNLQKQFQVAGFSVTGRILDSLGGSGIMNAKILIDGKQSSVSSKTGHYNLDNMKAGTYKITVQAEDIFFNDTTVKITPSTPMLPDVIAHSFSVCGKVVIDKVPEGLSQMVMQRRILVIPEGKTSEASSFKTESDGTFCLQKQPGKYVIKVHLSDQEVKAGLHLTPAERVVAVTNKPVTDIRFSQFRAKVSGTVNCMEKCGSIEVSLDAVGKTETKQLTKVKDSPKGSTFSFDNVMPGKYKATILQDSWCWKEKTLDIDVLDSDISVSKFIHSGYILKVAVSHNITLHFTHEKKEVKVDPFHLNKGVNRFCLAQPGIYHLMPDSCHKFEKDVYKYDTSNPEMLSLTANKHLANGIVKTEENVSDVTVTIKSSSSETPVVIGPLTASKPASTKPTENKQKEFTFDFSHWVRSGEKLTISVKSQQLLFTPNQVAVQIQGDSCPGEVARFMGRKGVFIIGSVKPALDGVSITVVVKDNSIEPISIFTEKSGNFKIGPLHSGIQYDVTAEKSGYVFTREAGDNVIFKALKLGEVEVQVTDETKMPLSGVLLSLSGGNQYRQNNVTTDSGSMKFASLSPGQYFLRSMMKEYKFEPNSQMVDVLEGTTMKIKITGIRVAFSCYGFVTSLNGEAEQGIVMEAAGLDDCSSFQEESKSEQDGSYRIRGLQPKCSYNVQIKSGPVNRHIERSAPSFKTLTVNDADFTDVNIIAFRRMNQMDISGNIITQSEYLSSLKIYLYREDDPDTAIHTQNLGSTSFFFLPSLQIDEKKYILRLDSSLSKSTYAYSSSELTFTANTSYKHFTLKFQPDQKLVDQELNQGSFLILPLTLLIIFITYQRQKILPVIMNIIHQLQTTSSKQIEQSVTQELPEMTSSKKKMKPRKI